MQGNTPWAGGPMDLQSLPTMAGRPRMGSASDSPPPAYVHNPQQFASIIDLSFNVTTASEKFLIEPPTKRNLLMLRNTDAAAMIYIGFGKNANTLSTLAIGPGITILFDSVVPQDDLYCIGSAACVLAYAYSTFGVQGQ